MVIPRAHLFGNPTRAAARISPDGAMLSWLAPVDGVLNVFVAPTDAPGDAVVVTRDDVSSETLRAWCAERLSDYKVPETMDLTAEPLPRNANGKVMKRQLRAALAAK